MELLRHDPPAQGNGPLCTFPELGNDVWLVEGFFTMRESSPRRLLRLEVSRLSKSWTPHVVCELV
jgi:hypothetical protein